MTKAELIARIAAENPDLGHAGARRLIDAMLGKLGQAFFPGRRVELRGFGTFTTRFVDERKSTNPRTGEAIITAPKTRTLFRAGKRITAALSGSDSGIR